MALSLIDFNWIKNFKKSSSKKSAKNLMVKVSHYFEEALNFKFQVNSNLELKKIKMPNMKNLPNKIIKNLNEIILIIIFMLENLKILVPILDILKFLKKIWNNFCWRNVLMKMLMNISNDQITKIGFKFWKIREFWIFTIIKLP